MKISTALFAVVVLSGCSPQSGDVADPITSASGNTPTAEVAQPPPAAELMTDTQHERMLSKENGAPSAGPGTSTTAVGTVTAVDAVSGKITIAHDSIEPLQWPAMTMGFKATPEQIASVKAGQKVEFAFVAEGMDATLTGIATMN